MPDDALHTVFSCQRWTEGRRKLQAEIGDFFPDSIILNMVEKESCWSCLSRYMHVCITFKTERLRQQYGGGTVNHLLIYLLICVPLYLLLVPL